MTLYTKGFSDRLSERQLNVLDVQRWADFPRKCYATQQEDSYYHCVFGDSHAQVLVWSLHKTAQERGKSAVIIAKGGCPPFLPGVTVVTNIEKIICEKVQQVAFNIATEGRDQFS